MPEIQPMTVQEEKGLIKPIPNGGLSQIQRMHPANNTSTSSYIDSRFPLKNKSNKTLDVHAMSCIPTLKVLYDYFLD